MVKKGKKFLVSYSGMLNSTVQINDNLHSGTSRTEDMHLVSGVKTTTLQAINTCLNFLIAKRDKVNIVTIRGIANTIYSITREYDFHNGIHESIYNFTKRVFKLEYLQKLKNEKRRNMNQFGDKEKLKKINSLQRCYSALLIKVYEVSPKELESFAGIQSSKLYSLITKILDEIVNEETSAKLQTNLREQEIDKALSNDSQSLRDIVVPVYNQILGLIFNVCKFSESEILTDMVIKLIVQRYKFLKLYGMCEISQKKSEINFYLEMMKYIAKLAMLREDGSAIFDITKQIVYKLMSISDPKKMHKMIDFSDYLMKDIIKSSSMSRIAQVIKLTSGDMIALRFKEEDSLSSSSFYANKTNIYVRWINYMLRKLEYKPNFEDENMMNNQDFEAYMNVWLLIVMDYYHMDEQMLKDVEKFGVHSPPLIEGSQRIYSNSMLRHSIFNSVSKVNESKFKSSIKKILGKLDPKIKKFIEHLRPNELSFIFAVYLSLEAKMKFMKENPEYTFEILGEDNSMIGSILTYLDNYLLYSNGGSHLQVALEKLVDFFGAKYVRILSEIRIVSIKLGIARQDLIVISQFACCETESFSKICSSLLLLYTTLFPPLFFKRKVVENFKCIISHLWNKLSKEYSLATEILNVPYIPQNTRLPSNSEKLKIRMSRILSTLVRLYLRARAINVLIAKTAISYTVQKSLKNNTENEDFGLRFVIMLNQMNPKYHKIETSRDKFMVLWMKDKREFDHKLDIDSKSIPPFIKQLYNGLKTPVKINMDDLRLMVMNINLPTKSYLDDFIGGLDFDRDYIYKKLKAFNKNCFNLEFCHIVDLTRGQFNYKSLSVNAKKILDRKLKEKDENKLVSIAVEMSDFYMNQIYEDLSLLMNLIHHKHISPISLLDRVLEIVSMYRVPKLYKHFFEDFLPNQMRVAAFKVDNLLILLSRVAMNLNSDFTSTAYENLYTSSWNDENIFTVKTKLFSKLYQNYFLFNNLRDNPHFLSSSSKLDECISSVSPSLHLKYLLIYKMEPSNSRCLDFIVDFIHKILPVAFMMGKKMTILISIFKHLMSIEQKSVSKINLSSYCKFNLSFLDMWRIVQKTKHRHSDLVNFHVNRVMEKFYFFNINYFGWTKYSTDLNKESYLTNNISEVNKLVGELSSIHQEINHLYNSLQVDTVKRHPIYDSYSREKKVFNDFKKTFLAKFYNVYTIRRVTNIMGFGNPELDSRKFFINLCPCSDSSELFFKVRTLLNTISYFISDEIDKIRSNFFMSLTQVKNLHTLELAKFSMEEMRNYTMTLFYLNPISSLSFVERFKYTVKEKGKNFSWIQNIYGHSLEMNAELFIKKKEFLSIYVDFLYESDKELLETKRVLMFWKMPHIQILLKYISKKFDQVKIIIDYFAKNMLRIDSEILTFYLAQIFQSLNNSCALIVENFLLDYAKKSPLLAHQLIWLAKVEMIKENNEHKKKSKEPEIDTTVQKRKFASVLGDKIIRNMNMDEINLWNQFNEFYNNLTKISSKLDPKWTKAKKKKDLNEMLNNVTLPGLVYLPTNPKFKVVDIKRGSGKPLQSAARCPIMVIFYCQKFEGPDKYFQKMKKLDNEFEKKDEIDKMLSEMNEVDESPIINKPKILFPYGLSGSNIFKAPLVNSLSKKSKKRSKEQIERNSDLPFKIEPKITKTKTSKSKSKSGHPINLTLGGKSSKLDQLTNTIYQDHTINLSVKKEHYDNSMYDFYVSSPVKINRTTNSVTKKNRISKFKDKRKRHSTQGSNNLKEISCIFKTRDDIRQDNLALQVIRIFQDIFAKVKLDLFVSPYKTISSRTGKNLELGGIIEFVPNSTSRDQIGKENNYDLYRFFNERFGNELSPMFQAARENFIRSMAAYSIVSYILQIKDRHNGNILIDEFGHLIHIDFGFIFDISPGGNMKFENAEFKLTSEMIQIMGGSDISEPFKLFVDLTIRAFLVVRKYREHIYNVVELIYESGMGCFMPESLQRFKDRFMEDKNDFAAAKQMRKIISNAYKNLRTILYDEIQYLQQKIAR